jgi:hypothetical protein
MIGLLVVAGRAMGQGAGPVQAPAQYLPNYYNRGTQPLSPYLNLFRGSNPGVDFYYGVRPGLPSGGQPFPGQRFGPTGGFSPFAFQYAPNPADIGSGVPGQGYVLPPAGHPNTYGNYFGIAGSSLPGYGNRGSAMPGLANGRPQPAKK